MDGNREGLSSGPPSGTNNNNIKGLMGNNNNMFSSLQGVSVLLRYYFFGMRVLMKVLDGGKGGGTVSKQPCRFLGGHILHI